MRKFSSLLYALFLSWTSKTGTYLKFTWVIEDWLCYLLSARAFVPISWNRLKNEEKKHIFYQRFHLILIVIAYIPYKFTANFSGSLVLADQITQCGLSLVKSIY